MPNSDENYVDPEELDPAEVIGPPRTAIGAATQALQRIEHQETSARPDDWLAAARSVAYLKFTNWDKVEMLWTAERRRKVDDASRELYRRLTTVARVNPGALLAPVETWIRDTLPRMRQGLTRHQEIRRKYRDPWEYNTSYEFIDQVIFPLDGLGYLLELVRDLKLQLGAETSAMVEEMEQTLRSSLPEIAEEFRRGGDSIDPVEPDMFPPSFWWRRLPGARPVES